MDGLSGASLDSAFLFTFIDIAKPASHVGIHESYENWLYPFSRGIAPHHRGPAA